MSKEEVVTEILAEIIIEARSDTRTAHMTRAELVAYAEGRWDGAYALCYFPECPRELCEMIIRGGEVWRRVANRLRQSL